MTEPEALQELREVLAAAIFNESEAIVRSFVKWADNIGDWRRVKFYRLADACIEAIRGAGWGPTAAHRQEDSGLTGTPQDGDLPSHTASLAATPQGCDDCFLLTGREAERQRVVLTDDFPRILCPKHRGEHGLEAWITGMDRGWGRCICGQEFTQGPGDDADIDDRMAEHISRIGDAGAHEPTSDQAGQSGPEATQEEEA